MPRTERECKDCYAKEYCKIDVIPLSQECIDDLSLYNEDLVLDEFYNQDVNL